MPIIDLDASKWTDAIAFCEDLMSVLGAPYEHGYSVDAFLDSIVWGGMNLVEPPYTVRLRNLPAASADAREQFNLLMKYLPEQKQEWRRQNGADLQVFFEIVP